MSKIDFTAPCLLGLEGLVAGELKRMDAASVQAENGRVFFSGDEQMLARANLCSRYSERICVVLGRFSARTFDELFEGVRALEWERFIGRVDAFPVKGSALNSKLHSVPDCQKIIKKAIVERLKASYSLPWLEETGELVQVRFLILKDQACLMLDTSGEGLHKRGYRQNGAIAPIKETLAAAMADISFVRRNSRVLDPCCGSGTLLIESALKALNIAPGIRRSFAAEKWGCLSASVWRSERERALSLVSKDSEFSALGSDISDEVLAVARENARKAGVDKRIVFEKRDLRRFKAENNSVLLCNPPYGERLLDIESARELYTVMGECFLPGERRSYAVISPDEQFEDYFGRKADKRRKLYNGMIKCQLFSYFNKA